jgi:hypothetical protein
MKLSVDAMLSDEVMLICACFRLFLPASQLLTVVILFVGLTAVAVTGALMGLTQSDIGYSSVWMNSDMGAAVGQALILGLVTYLVSMGCTVRSTDLVDMHEITLGLAWRLIRSY